MNPREIWEPIKSELDKIGIGVQKIRAAHANSKTFLENVRKFVQDYFNKYRSILVSRGINVDDFDVSMQDLYKLTTTRSLTSRYSLRIRSLKKQLSLLEVQNLIPINNADVSEKPPYTSIEKSILETLERIAPAIAVSYNQVLIDVNDQMRVSFRGSAAEIREVLRGVLEILAPDNEVEKMPGFKFEKDNNRPDKNLTSPTMKQKVRFILKSRGKSSGSMEVPEVAVGIIDELVSIFTRSIYARGSIATHTNDGAGREELQRLKMYVDTVLCELLEIKL